MKSFHPEQLCDRRGRDRVCFPGPLVVQAMIAKAITEQSSGYNSDLELQAVSQYKENPTDASFRKVLDCLDGTLRLACDNLVQYGIKHVSYADRCALANLDKNDTYAAAYTGVYTSLGRFDPSNGAPFIRYAAYRVAREIQVLMDDASCFYYQRGDADSSVADIDAVTDLEHEVFSADYADAEILSTVLRNTMLTNRDAATLTRYIEDGTFVGIANDFGLTHQGARLRFYSLVDKLQLTVNRLRLSR